MQAGEDAADDRHPSVRAGLRRAVGEGVRDAGVADVGAADRRRHTPEVDAARPGPLAPVQPRQHQLHHQRQNP